ncbi:MAG: hypothetical protein R3335_04850 [Anaerolineales bacterium]|nr:hypothetical protein [Anaerolineales bacterium]
MSADTVGAVFLLVVVVLALLIMALYIASLVWLYRDSHARGKTGCMWLLIAFFTWPFGVLAYFLLRDQTVTL